MRLKDVVTEAKGKHVIAYEVVNGQSIMWLDDKAFMERFFLAWHRHCQTKWSQDYVGDPQKNFKGPVKTWIEKRPESTQYLQLRRVTELPNPIPGSLRAFVPHILPDGNMANLPDFVKNEEVYVLRIGDTFNERVMHLIDYIDMSYSEGGTGPRRYGDTQQKLNSQQPERLIQDAEQAEKKAEKENQKRKADPFYKKLDDSDGTKRPIINKNRDGTYWVQISGHAKVTDADYPELAKALPIGKNSKFGTLRATNPLLRREGFLMGHCIGSSTHYDSTNNYSLRDSANHPQATVEMRGNTVVQVAGHGNKAPKRQYSNAVLEFINKMNVDDITDGRFKEMGIIKIGDLYMSAELVERAVEKDPQLLIRHGITEKQQKELGLVRIGDRLLSRTTVAREIASGEMDARDLDDADFNNDDLSAMGLIRMDNGRVKRWAELKKGDVIKGDVSFRYAHVDPKIPDGVRITGNLTLDHMPVELQVLPALKVDGNLNITGSHFNTIKDGFSCGGSITIRGTGITNWPKTPVTCKEINIDGDAAIKEMTNLTVTDGTAELIGVRRIGKGCRFASTARFTSGRLEHIDPDTRFELNVYAENTAITEWPVREVGGLLELSNCAALTKLPRGLIVGSSPKNSEEGGYDLWLQGTAVLDYPPDMVIKGAIHMASREANDPPIRTVPENLTAEIMTYTIGKLKYLPKGIEVFDYLGFAPQGKNTIFFQFDPGDNEDKIILDDDKMTVLATGQVIHYNQLTDQPTGR